MVTHSHPLDAPRPPSLPAPTHMSKVIQLGESTHVAQHMLSLSFVFPPEQYRLRKCTTWHYHQSPDSALHLTNAFHDALLHITHLLLDDF